MSTVPAASICAGVMRAPVTFQVGKNIYVCARAQSSTTICVDLGFDWRGWRCVLAQLYPLCVLRI